MRQTNTFKLIALLAAGLAAAPTHAGLFCKDEVKFPADGNSFVVRDVRVVDGGNVLEHANVVVRAGRIRSVGQDAPPADLNVVDGAGRTLIAGPADDISNLTAYGVAMHAKLQGMTKGGMSTLEALKATTNAAGRATPPDYRGRVAPGAYADLILVNGNPVADINATRSIARAFKNGFEMKRSAPTSP
jgi:imidazolonepropionase-like amidohydrolase